MRKAKRTKIGIEHQPQMKENNLMLDSFFFISFSFAIYFCQNTRIQCTFHIIYKHKAGILL